MYLAAPGGVWHLQEDAANEQKLLEQHNIATALYYDVSTIENKFNSSMQGFSSFTKNDTRVFNDPYFMYYATDKYYSINWNYNTVVSKFLAATANFINRIQFQHN